MGEKSVKAQWESYAEFVLPDDCGPEPRLALRHAFYAGASSMMIMLFDTSKHIPVGEHADYVEGLRRECLAFQGEVASGGA
jgi:hypothetical protein